MLAWHVGFRDFGIRLYAPQEPIPFSRGMQDPMDFLLLLTQNSCEAADLRFFLDLFSEVQPVRISNLQAFQAK